MDQKDQGKTAANTMIAVQTVVLCAAAAGVFLQMGRRDQTMTMNSLHISELRSITQDLVKSQVLSEANDANHSEMIADLKRRVDGLSERGNG